MFSQAVLELLIVAFVLWCFFLILYRVFTTGKDKEIEKQKVELEKLKKEVDTINTLNQVISRLDELETELERVKK